MVITIKTEKDRLNGKRFHAWNLQGFDYSKFFGEDFKWSKKADDNIKIIVSTGIVMGLYGFGVFDVIPYPALQGLLSIVSGVVVKKVLDFFHFLKKSN